MLLKKGAIICGVCNNEIELCFCACPYCGSQDSCECLLKGIKKKDFAPQAMLGSRNKILNSIKTYDHETTRLEKWHIGRRNFS